MDYTDGSKEAKLLQELLHLIEDAVFRGGGSLEGNFPDIIMKEMRKKGFSGNDFSFTSTLPQYVEEYHKALVAAGIPYLRVPDIHGNAIFVVRTEDSSRLLDIDASIKKGSTRYTRSDYIGDFVKNERALGHEIYRLKMSDSQTHEILANKSFDHEAGFVTSYHDGYCYFSESAVNSEIAAIFLDTAVSTREGSFLCNVKRMNNLHEQTNVSELTDYMKRGDVRNFVNAFDNRSDYLHVENGILEVHSFTGQLDTVIESYNIRDFDSKEEALDHIVAQSLARIHNCESTTQSKLSGYLKLSRGELAERREDALLTEAKLLADLKENPHPESFSEDSLYLVTDKDTLEQTGKLLQEKLDSAVTPEEQKEYSRLLRANQELSMQKNAQRKLLEYTGKELSSRCFLSQNYKFLSAKEKLDFQLQSMTYILQTGSDASIENYLDYAKITREELVNDFCENYSKIELFSPSAQMDMAHTETKASVKI